MDRELIVVMDHHVDCAYKVSREVVHLFDLNKTNMKEMIGLGN
jgi:hypothetical protein